VIDPTLRPAWVVSRINGSRISPATTEVAPGWIKQFLGLLWSRISPPAFPRACYELGQKSHRNADFTVSLVPSRSLFPAFLSRF
jgi:hypothetical protein